MTGYSFFTYVSSWIIIWTAIFTSSSSPLVLCCFVYFTRIVVHLVAYYYFSRIWYPVTMDHLVCTTAILGFSLFSYAGLRACGKGSTRLSWRPGFLICGDIVFLSLLIGINYRVLQQTLYNFSSVNLLEAKAVNQYWITRVVDFYGSVMGKT